MSEPPKKTVIGIDLGTKNSCIGIWIAENNSVEILNNDIGETTTPSSIAYTGSSQDDMQITVGERAQSSENWIYDAKRMIGKAIQDEDLQIYMEKWPFIVVEGPRHNCEISIPGLGNFKVEEVSSHVLGYLKKIAERKVGTPVKDAVITVPAYFNNS